MAETIDVLEAARRLGVTPDAVRARLRRGTLEGYRDNSGNWRIVSSDTTVSAPTDTTLEPYQHDADTTRHDGVSPELTRLLKALVERIEADQARLIKERDVARADADKVKAEQIQMALDFSEKYAELHADCARLETVIERLQDERNRAVLDADQVQEEIKLQRDHANALLRTDAGISDAFGSSTLKTFRPVLSSKLHHLF
jgi:hypothetical protein